MKKVRISLQVSESVVFEAAGRIYAAFVAGAKVKEGEEQQWMERATQQAIQLAQIVEQSVQSDSELD
jgi:hypothetical protein